MSRRSSSPRESIPTRDPDLLRKQATPVRLSLLRPGLPIVLLAAFGNACYLTGREDAGPTKSARGILEGTNPIARIALAPDGETLATIDTSGSVRLSQTETTRNGIL